MLWNVLFPTGADGSTEPVHDALLLDPAKYAGVGE